MAKNLKEVKDANKASNLEYKLDYIDFDMIALSKELEKIGVKASKVLDTCNTFMLRISKQIPRDTAPFGQVLAHSFACMIAMDLHIKATHMQSNDFGNSVLKFCYEHYRGLYIRTRLQDDNGNLKE